MSAMNDNGEQVYIASAFVMIFLELEGKRVLLINTQTIVEVADLPQLLCLCRSGFTHYMYMYIIG